jgi:hypothetical protein
MNWLKRNDLAVFLFLAFSLSWWPWPLTLMNPNSTPMMPWGPMVAAFIVLGLTRGWTGMKSLLGDMFRWRVGARWYALDGQRSNGSTASTPISGTDDGILNPLHMDL